MRLAVFTTFTSTPELMQDFILWTRISHNPTLYKFEFICIYIHIYIEILSATHSQSHRAVPAGARSHVVCVYVCVCVLCVCVVCVCERECLSATHSQVTQQLLMLHAVM